MLVGRNASSKPQTLNPLLHWSPRAVRMLDVVMLVGRNAIEPGVGTWRAKGTY